MPFMPSPAAPAASTVTIPTRRPGQATVLTRLQGLFPTSPTTTTHPIPALPEPQPTSPRRSSMAMPKSLKVRIVTWNMHDSVPKGDLEELLGKVPGYTTPDIPTAAGSFPQLPVDDHHPYHLVVIAGQECPSMSGIPMGLGAGFKLIDREKDRDADRGEREKAKERDKDYDKPRSKLRDIYKDDLKDPPSHEGAGWTAMIEDWLCHGARQAPTTPSDISAPKPLSARAPKERRGPYQLLIKERMMGLYLAIYIHRDLRPLVKGTSRSAVTAGLIGGRVGNKGGVGISVDLDGCCSLLFINAHLAAHEGKVNHRLANFAKIKAELTVDDFLAPDDPRVMSEDLTDKFDYTFLCGDLNFRLDISRLHADWLISRQDYAQALAFDQLRNLMLTGKAFVGFNEAPIDFPPTFKYDVLRTIKQKRRSARLDRWRTPGAHRLTEVDEHGDEHEPEDLDGEESDKEGEVGEAASLSSSVWTSMHSRPGTDGDDDYFHPSPSTYSSPGSRISISTAAHKAKTKWLSLLSPASPHSPTKWLRTKQTVFAARHESSPAMSAKIEAKVVLTERPSSLDAVLPPNLKRLSSTKSSLPSDEEEEGDDKGVYDSSHKKRVPSWCDRVLWKSTVEPDPEPEDDDPYDFPTSRPRTRMGQFFANAFRPLSGRPRRGSYSSFTSAVSVATSSATTDADVSVTDSSPPSPEVTQQAAPTPFSRFVEPQGRLLSHSRSNEVFSAKQPPAPSRALSNEAAPGLNSSASSSSHNLPTPPSVTRPRRADSLGSLTTALQNHSRVATPSRWRFFPSFLSHNSTQSSSSQDPPASIDTIPPRPPRRGEVICLNYNTLDDRGMRRLEGRSDHRPVIASYAVYI